MAQGGLNYIQPGSRKKSKKNPNFCKVKKAGDKQICINRIKLKKCGKGQFTFLIKTQANTRNDLKDFRNEKTHMCNISHHNVLLLGIGMRLLYMTGHCLLDSH